MDAKIRLFQVLTLLLCLPVFSSVAQTNPIQATEIQGYSELKLDAQFLDYKVYQINSIELVNLVRSADFDHKVALELPGYGAFGMELFENPVVREDYVLTVATETGITHTPWDGIVKTFRGNLTGGQYVVSLTINENFIYGFIQRSAKEELRIEPLNLYLDTAEDDQYIVFETSQGVKQIPTSCEVREHHDHITSEAEEENLESHSVVCREIQIAFADDWLMHQAHGGVSGVEDHNMGVINDVQNNYDTEFQDDLVFVVTEIWVSTCSTCDPWTSSTNAGALLDDFTDWGPSGFSNTHDVAGLWTDRDFNGSTVGISWVDAACSGFRYLACQDWTGNGSLLRCTLAHELGHNFGSNHDPSGSNTIMAPSVSNTNAWSSSSINQINSYMNQISCLSVCLTVEAPIADFSADDVEGCEPFVVHFTDESTGPPTAWDWTFPGGSPGTSTMQNPTVTYNLPGTYDVILEVSNSAGTSTLVKTDYITVLSEPLADFVYDQIDLTLNFTSLSQDADSWSWDFGDGGVSSQENPSHTYNQDGEYEVVLTVTNACGSDEYIVFIEVYVAPEADFSYSPDFGCAPLIVNFYNESTDNVQSLEWYFPGGSPATSTQENPVVTYSQPGFYSVTLIVENIAGLDELTINNIIEVAPFPEADFNFAVNGLSVQFINGSIDGDNYLWVFGDGMTSTAYSPNHVYSGGGTYQVMLVTSNECGSDTAFATVVLNSAPIADFTVSVSSGCVPLTVTYMSTSQGVVTSYNWSFPGGSPSSSSAMSPVVTYNAVGSYSAQLIVSNTIGADTIQYQDVVVVYPDVVSGFDVDIAENVVDLTNSSTGAETYLWLIEGNAFNSVDLQYVFEEDGDYPVMLIATGDCGSDTTVQIIHIATPPMAGIASSTTSGCQPLTVQFYNNSSNNATMFAWVFEGGSPGTSSEEDPLVTYNAPGVYDVQLTVWSEAGMDVQMINDMIEVAPLPVAQFTTDQAGLSITFDNISLYADQYFWTFGDGGTSTDPDPVHAYADYGTYTVTLISENACGFDTAVVNLELSTAPVPAFGAGQTQGCVPLEVQFTDMSQNMPELWEWSFPGGSPDTSNLQHPVIVYSTPGIYSVTLRVSNAGGAQALVRDEYIYVATPPVADFDFVVDGGTVTFTNQTDGSDQFFWTFGDGGVDTAANPIHVYNLSGTYQVQLISWNVCAADTIVQDVTVIITALNDPEQAAGIRVYPNPHRGTFNLDISADGVFDLVVYDVLGRLVHSERLDVSKASKHEISLRDPSPGVYTVVVRKEEISVVVKMIVVD